MINIKFLKDCTEHINQLAIWHQKEWNHLNPSYILENRILNLEEECKSDRFFTLVAVDGDVLLGSASLVDNDMDSHLDLSPWLASVYVNVDHRSKGIGSSLVEAVVKEAATRGEQELWLFTHDQRKLYERLGWVHISREIYKNEEVDLMLKNNMKICRKVNFTIPYTDRWVDISLLRKC